MGDPNTLLPFHEVDLKETLGEFTNFKLPTLCFLLGEWDWFQIELSDVSQDESNVFDVFGSSFQRDNLLNLGDI